MEFELADSSQTQLIVQLPPFWLTSFYPGQSLSLCTLIQTLPFDSFSDFHVLWQ